MYKKGQVTIFIIFGIIILALFAVGAYLFYSKPVEDIKNEEKIVTDVDSVKFYVNSCLKKSLSNTVWYVSLQGGYYDTPERPIKYDLGLDYSVDIPYYLYSKDLIYPDDKKITEQFEKGVAYSFLDCLDFSTFAYEITMDEKKLDVDVIFSKNKIKAEARLPIKIKEGDSITEIEYFATSANSEFNNLYSIAKNITLEQSESNGEICISCIRKQAMDTNTQIDFFEIESKSDLYFVTTDDTVKFYSSPSDRHYSVLVYLITIQGFEGPEVFAFAHKYDLNQGETREETTELAGTTQLTGTLN